jgi:hypothetical protein
MLPGLIGPLEQMPGFLRYTAIPILTAQVVTRALRLSAAGGGLSALRMGHIGLDWNPDFR